MTTIKKGLITIKNKTADAYRAYLSDDSKSIDYHLAVKQESTKKLQMLKEKAKAEANSPTRIF